MTNQKKSRPRQEAAQQKNQHINYITILISLTHCPLIQSLALLVIVAMVGGAA